jgi:hypothetical protein
MDGDGTTEAIDCAIAGSAVDHAFTDAAAAALAGSLNSESGRAVF